MKRYSKIIKENVKELTISIMYFFRQIGKLLNAIPTIELGGNLDTFYLLAPLELFNRIKTKTINYKYVLVFIPILLYMIFQAIFIENVIISKLLINVLKICICIMITFFVINNIKKINLYKTAKIITVFMAIGTIISLIFKESNILWRFNDLINKYTTTRLELFYMEPSELGFHVAIVVIVLLSYFFVFNDKKEKIKILMYIMVDLFIIYLARPFGTIVILAGCVCVILILNLIKNFSKTKLFIYISLAIIGCATVGIMYYTESPIVMRAIDTINGTDSSNNYRINVSMEILTESLEDYHYIGCGFGNLNSHQFRNRYSDKGIAEVLANSFIYFIIEGGIFSIISIIILIIFLTKNAIKEYSLMKVGLLLFLVAYQIFGGHFTSGLTWAIYGIIISSFNENQSYNKK